MLFAKTSSAVFLLSPSKGLFPRQSSLSKQRISRIRRLSVRKNIVFPLRAENGGGSGGNAKTTKTGGNDDEEQPSDKTKQLTFLYAFFILIGGVMGFLKRKSKMSLITSLGFFAMMALCGYGIGGPLNMLSISVALIGSGGLGIFFLKRYLTSRKPFPGLVGSVISFSMSILYIYDCLHIIQ